MKPSSRPMMSSWEIPPRLVWKDLPGSRQMLWRRPLASVRRTHSPGCQRSAAYAGPVVGRRRPGYVVHLRAPSSKARSTSTVASTPKMEPSPRRGRTPRRACATWPGPGPRPRCRPAAPGPSSRVRATELTGTQARRSSGVASSAASLTMPLSRSSPAWTTIAPASALLRPAYGLGDGQVVGDGDHPAGERARLECGQPPAHAGADHRGGRPGPQERGDDHRHHEVEDVGPGGRRTRASGSDGQNSTDGDHASAPRRRRWCRGACCRSASRRTPRAPDRRRAAGPGTRLSTPTTRLAHGETADGEAEQAVGGDQRAAARTASADRRSRSADRRPRP